MECRYFEGKNTFFPPSSVILDSSDHLDVWSCVNFFTLRLTAEPYPWGNLNTAPPSLFITVQTPIYTTSGSWQQTYLGYFNLIFVPWEEVKMHCPSLYVSTVWCVSKLAFVNSQ